MTHKPQRFEVYTELEDGSGFKIPGNDHVFLFTKQGGWFDEDNNYYNANGDPSEPHESQQSSSESRSSQQSESDYQSRQSDEDFYQDIVNQYKYDNNDDYQDHNYNAQQLRNMEKIASNQQILTNYHSNKPLRVYYSNMDYNYTAQKVKKAYESYAKILAVEPTKHNSNGRKGEGYFIVANKQQALKLVQLQGKIILSDRKVYFYVQNIQQLIVDPISTNIWKTNPQKEQQKQPVKIQIKQQLKSFHKQSKQSKSNEQKQKSNFNSNSKQKQQQNQKQKQQNKDNRVYNRYRVQTNNFESGAEFKSWMKQLGLQINKDYKDMKKKTFTLTNQQFAIISMPVQTFEKCQNQKYKDKTIVFTLYV